MAFVAPPPQCAGTCASLITPPQVCVSFLMKAAASAGVPPAACRLSLANLSCTSLLASTALTAALSLATIAGRRFGRCGDGVPRARLEVLHADLVERRDIGQGRNARRRRHRQDARLAGLVQLEAEASSMKIMSTWPAMRSLSAGAVPL